MTQFEEPPHDELHPGDLSFEEYHHRYGFGRVDDEGSDFEGKFSVHNVLVGLLLFAWSGYLTFSGYEQVPEVVQSAFARHPKLLLATNLLQYYLAALGLTLAASGVLIKKRHPLGMPIATACGVLMILGGVFFGFAYSYLNKVSHEIYTLPIYYFQMNIDLVIGFVDGIFLLKMLWRRNRSDRFSQR